MRMNIIKKHALAIAALLLAIPAQAEIAVIVNNGGASLSQDEVSQVFLGKNKSMTPVMAEGSASDEFIEKVLSRSPSQFKAYWAKLAFTGGGRPPQTSSASDIVSKVASDAKTIGVVDAGAVTGDVKVLFKL